jgi:hypothetical protein
MAMTAEEARRAFDELRNAQMTTAAALAELQDHYADLRNQNIGLAAAHEQSHSELGQLRAAVGQGGGGGRPDRQPSLFEPRVMVPGKFGAKGPGAVEWRDWSYEARHYIGRVDPNLPGTLQS